MHRMPLKILFQTGRIWTINSEKVRYCLQSNLWIYEKANQSNSNICTAFHKSMKTNYWKIFKKKNCKMLYYIKLHKNNIANYSTDAHCTSNTKAHHQGPHSHRSTRNRCLYQCSRQSTSCNGRSWQNLMWRHTPHKALSHDWWPLWEYVGLLACRLMVLHCPPANSVMCYFNTDEFCYHASSLARLLCNLDILPPRLVPCPWVYF